MNFKGIYYSLTFRLALAIGLTAALTYQALEKEWGWFLFLGIGGWLPCGASAFCSSGTRKR